MEYNLLRHIATFLLEEDLYDRSNGLFNFYYERHRFVPQKRTNIFNMNVFIFTQKNTICANAQHIGQSNQRLHTHQEVPALNIPVKRD